MRTAIFDLDGTLADTAPDLIGAANDLLRARDLQPLDPQKARATAGRGGKALISRGFEEASAPLSQDEVLALFPTYLEAYEARIADETRLFEGVEPALQELAAADWRLCVCTNKPERLAAILLEKLGLASWFPALVGADTLPVRKPDPRPLFEAVFRANGDISRAVMIGDSRTDRDAARNAETPVALVDFGYSDAPASTMAPDALISHFRELPAALNTIMPEN